MQSDSILRSRSEGRRFFSTRSIVRVAFGLIAAAAAGGWVPIAEYLHHRLASPGEPPMEMPAATPANCQSAPDQAPCRTGVVMQPSKSIEQLINEMARSSR